MKNKTAKMSDKEKKWLRKAKALLEKRGLNSIPAKLGTYSAITDGTVIELGSQLLCLYLQDRLNIKDEQKDIHDIGDANVA